MPAYVPRQGDSRVRLPVFDTPDNPADWPNIERALGRELTEAERTQIRLLVTVYVLARSQELYGAPTPQIAGHLQRLNDLLRDPVVRHEEELTAFFKARTDDAALVEARWMLSPANGRRPPGDIAALRQIVADQLRLAQRPLELRAFHKAERQGDHDPLSVEDEDGHMTPASLHVPAPGFLTTVKPLIVGLAEIWSVANSPPTARKDSAKARSPRTSDFVGLCRTVLEALPLKYRSHGDQGLTTAVSGALRDRTRKTKPATEREK